MHFHYYSGSPTKKVPKRKATTEQDLDEMKAKIEDERKKLKDVKNMAEEEKNKIKFELKRQEDELAKVRILGFKFSFNPLRFSLQEKLTKQTVKSQKLSNLKNFNTCVLGSLSIWMSNFEYLF